MKTRIYLGPGVKGLAWFPDDLLEPKSQTVIITMYALSAKIHCTIKSQREGGV